MQLIDFSFCARATGPDLLLTISLDQKALSKTTLDYNAREFKFEFVDEPGPHCLELQMSGKLPEHTKIDPNGIIVQDQVIEISDMKLDGILLGQLFFDKACYQHDFNGTQPPVADRFFGVMGCNGVVRFEFSSPLYLWLLENM